MELINEEEMKLLFQTLLRSTLEESRFIFDLHCDRVIRSVENLILSLKKTYNLRDVCSIEKNLNKIEGMTMMVRFPPSLFVCAYLVESRRVLKIIEREDYERKVGIFLENIDELLSTTDRDELIEIESKADLFLLSSIESSLNDKLNFVIDIANERLC